MNKQELIAALLSAAETLQRTELDNEELDFSCEITLFGTLTRSVLDRNDFVTMLKRIDDRSLVEHNGSHWIQGRLAGLSTTIHFNPKVLGKRRVKTIKVIDVEAVDLEAFIAEHGDSSD